MDELTRMIDRTDQVINFYVKCPEGKRGRLVKFGWKIRGKKQKMHIRMRT